MTTETTLETTDERLIFIDTTVEIVNILAARSDVPAESIPGLITAVYSSLVDLGKPEPVVVVAEPVSSILAERPPAVAINESVFPEYIVCLEDGKKLKMLKRHLQSAYQLTPEQYRARWGLAPNYPMTAPSYAAVRSTLAKKSGLGTKTGVKTKKTVKKAVAPRKRAAKK